MDEAVDATRAAIDASQAAANTSLAEPPSPRTARKRNDRNAEQGAAADAAQARPRASRTRRPDAAAGLSAARSSRRRGPAAAHGHHAQARREHAAPGPTAMPVEAQAADAAPVAWTRRRKQAMP